MAKIFPVSVPFRSAPLIVVLSALVIIPGVPRGHAAEALELTSPAKSLTVRVSVDGGGRLTWSLNRGGTPLVHASPLGITLDGSDLGLGVTIGKPTMEEIRESYAWRGVKSKATNHCLAYRIPIGQVAGGTFWELEVRVFEDGCAWRYRVPGNGDRRVTGEASGWTLPAEGTAWFQTNTGDYEGAYQSAPAGAIPHQTSDTRNPRPLHLGPPVTVDLGGDGYLLLTEANLVNYSGLTLRPTGTPRLEAAFEDDPQGFLLTGEILSPWRVTVAVPDLDRLVNSDVIPSLCPPPDAALFPAGPATPWIQPGRALVTWCVFGNDGARWDRQKWFVDRSADLGCELLLVDAGWRTERWGWLAGGGNVWARLKELCEYAATRRVGIVVWHAYPEGRDDGPGLTQPAARQELFRRCQDAGVKGVKIDFFNSERLEVVRVYEELARLAAQHQLTINFHGAHKPTGEVRTWPNEITREGIREQEYVLWESLPLEHYAALPFTRMAVGHADFLPAYVRTKYLRNTTATFQAATAIVATSSFMSWPDHPDDYRVSPFLGLLKAVPLAWDDTRVLPGSAIGKVAAFARRRGAEWFVGVLNGTDRPQSWRSDVGFLGDGEFSATLYRDSPPHHSLPSIETGRTLRRGEMLAAELAPGGGFVAWMQPAP